MALLKKNCPEAAWIRTTSTPGFDIEGYWAIKISRGSRIAHTDNRDNSTKKLTNRWVTRYAQKNAARANKASKWGLWRVKGGGLGVM